MSSNVSPVIIALETVKNERFWFRYFAGIIFTASECAPVSRLSLLVDLEEQQHSGTYISLHQQSSEICSGGKIDGIGHNTDSPRI
jgi:hypothetical protein